MRNRSPKVEPEISTQDLKVRIKYLMDTIKVTLVDSTRTHLQRMLQEDEELLRRREQGKPNV